MKTTNPIGVISMFYARPFGREHFSTFARMKAAGADVVELLVPEPGELDLAETRAAAEDAGLSVVLAARVNLSRDLASSDAHAHRGRRRVSRELRRNRNCAWGDHRRRPALRRAARVCRPRALPGRRPTSAGAGSTPWCPGSRRQRRGQQTQGSSSVVEPLNRFETDIANTAGHAIEIVDRVGSPGLSASCSTPFT